MSKASDDPHLTVAHVGWLHRHESWTSNKSLLHFMVLAEFVLVRSGLENSSQTTYPVSIPYKFNVQTFLYLGVVAHFQNVCSNTALFKKRLLCWTNWFHVPGSNQRCGAGAQAILDVWSRGPNLWDGGVGVWYLGSASTGIVCGVREVYIYITQVFLDRKMVLEPESSIYPELEPKIWVPAPQPWLKPKA